MEIVCLRHLISGPAAASASINAPLDDFGSYDQRHCLLPPFTPLLPTSFHTSPSNQRVAAPYTHLHPPSRSSSKRTAPAPHVSRNIDQATSHLAVGKPGLHSCSGSSNEQSFTYANTTYLFRVTSPSSSLEEACETNAATTINPEKFVATTNLSSSSTFFGEHISHHPSIGLSDTVKSW